MSSGPLAVSSKSDFIGHSFAVGLNSASSPDERSDIRDYSHISPDFAALIRATLAAPGVLGDIEVLI